MRGPSFKGAAPGYPPSLFEDGSIMKHTTTQGLYQYWNTVRGSRLAPRRFEIEPSQITPFLAETMILEQPLSRDCRVRLAGTRVTEMLGRNLRGQTFYDLWSHDDRRILADNMRTIVAHGGVGLFGVAGTLRDDIPAAEFEMLLLPLTHLGDRVERVLGSLSIVRPTAWIKTSPPVRLVLRRNDIIWPEGRPRSLKSSAPPLAAMSESRDWPMIRDDDRDDDPDGDQPSDVLPRRARLVRSDTRSFLVYDGGRADTTTGGQDT